MTTSLRNAVTLHSLGLTSRFFCRGLKVDTLILCGGLTDVCVHYTFVDGHQSDYFCRVIEDCVAGSSEQAHEAALTAMEYLQTGARCAIDDVLDAMDQYSMKRPENRTSCPTQ